MGRRKALFDKRLQIAIVPARAGESPQGVAAVKRAKTWRVAKSKRGPISPCRESCLATSEA
jgi:hypothetical protein